MEGEKKMKWHDDVYMCDIEGCSSTNETCLIVEFIDLDLDLCEHHLYLVPRLFKAKEYIEKEQSLETD